MRKGAACRIIATFHHVRSLVLAHGVERRFLHVFLQLRWDSKDVDVGSEGGEDAAEDGEEVGCRRHVGRGELGRGDGGV